MIFLRGKLTERRPLDVPRDRFREMTRGAYRDVGEYWVQHYLQGHFDVGAGQKYGYKFRSRAYRDRKDRLRAAGRPFTKGGAPVIGGSEQPNVLTGYMRREMSRNIVIRGFPTRCTVIMYGPKYLTTRFFKKAQPNKPAELTKLRTEEIRVLSGVLRDGFMKRLNAYRAARVRVTE
jgi:hypothetical protein